MNTRASPPAHDPPHRPHMPGAWLWWPEERRYLPVPEPVHFPLHPLAATDPRWHTLALAARVEIGEPTFVLWDVQTVLARPWTKRGRIATAIDAATAWDGGDGDPDLLLDDKPYRFLRAEAVEYRTWLLALARRHGVWFTHDGAALQSLLGIVVELARVVG